MTYSVQDVLLIIGAVTTMVCSIIAALKTTTTGKKVDQHGVVLAAQDKTLAAQDKALDRVETQTNGHLAMLNQELAAKRQEVDALKAQAVVAEAVRQQVADARRALIASKSRDTKRKAARKGRS